jgi:hypothetical protein
MESVELRPLGIGELLDVAIRVTLRHAGTLVRAVLVVVLPLQILSSIAYVSGGVDQVNNGSDGQWSLQGDVDPWAFGVSLAVVGIIAAITPLLASGVCFKAVGDAYLGGTSDWRSSLRYTLPRLHSILWVTILGGLGVLVGFVLCIVPGIWIGVSWAIAVPVLLTEGARGSNALRRSFHLVKGRWWGTFGALAIAFILVGVVSAAISALLSAVSLDPTGHSDLVDFVLRVVSGTVSSLITTPFTAALTVALYIDLRVRKEGFDVQLLAAQIGLEPGEPVHVPAPPSLPGTPPPPPTPSSGDQPPFWPPPPGWRPRDQE